MAEPVGAAERDGLVDGRQPERLTGVNGEVRVGSPHVFERVEVTARRVSGFGAGDVESGDPPVAEPYGEFRDLP